MLTLGFEFSLASVLPLLAIVLICAICPIAMFVMMRGMNSRPK